MSKKKKQTRRDKYKHRTGLDNRQFDRLYRAVCREKATQKPKSRGGRPNSLSIRKRLIATLMMLRCNTSLRHTAEIYGVSHSIIGRARQEMEPIIKKVLRRYVVDVERAVLSADDVILVDGTPVKVTDWRELGTANYSGKSHMVCVNLQVMTDRRGKILALGEVRPGKTHDKRALDELGWTELLGRAPHGWCADLGYLGTDAIHPTRKPPDVKEFQSREDGTLFEVVRKGELTDEQRAENKRINSMRSPVEHANARIKKWQILRIGFRRPLKDVDSVIQLIGALDMYRVEAA